MKTAIIGTGGVGGYFGGKIANAGFDVTFLARGEHLKAIQSNGLKVKSISGDFSVYPARATDKVEEIGFADLIILGVKAWQVRPIAKELKAIVKKNTMVLPLQNGVLAADEVEEALGRDHVIGGLCRILSKVEAPGVIHHSGVDPMIVFGELNNQKTDRVAEIKNLFDRSGIHSKIADDIQSEIWRKFITICVSGLLAVTRSTYGVVRELKETRGMIRDLLSEIHFISQKAGIHLELNIVNQTMSDIDTYPYDSTASLTRDVWDGKPSEIEYQNGTVVRLAEKYGVDVPVNRFIYHCILPMELKARNRSDEFSMPFVSAPRISR